MWAATTWHWSFRHEYLIATSMSLSCADCRWIASARLSMIVQGINMGWEHFNLQGASSASVMPTAGLWKTIHEAREASQESLDLGGLQLSENAKILDPKDEANFTLWSFSYCVHTPCVTTFEICLKGHYMAVLSRL